MKISSVIEDVIWHKRHEFYKVSLLHVEMVQVIVSEDIIYEWTRHCVFVIGQNVICKY